METGKKIFETCCNNLGINFEEVFCYGKGNTFSVDGNIQRYVFQTTKTQLKPKHKYVVKYFAKEEMSKRLETIFREINLWLCETKPDVVAIEQLFFNTNTTTAIAVAQARGVILLACQLQGVSVYEYTPLQVKQAVVGYGKAEKMQVQKMVKTLLNLEKVPKPDDVADALAVAICHTNYAGYHSFLDKTR